MGLGIVGGTEKPPRVTDMRAVLNHYTFEGKPVTGTNLLYKVDGRPRSSRVPWVVTNPMLEVARIERLLERTNQ